MSGLREIIEWIKREVILDPENSVDREFESISTMFTKDKRSALADILRDDTPEFLEFLESRLAKLRDSPQADQEIETLESRVESLESSIESVLEGIIQGAVNMLGTPIRLADEAVTPIIRPVIIEFKKTGIIESIKGFFRGLFS